MTSSSKEPSVSPLGKLRIRCLVALAGEISGGKRRGGDDRRRVTDFALLGSLLPESRRAALLASWILRPVALQVSRQNKPRREGPVKVGYSRLAPCGPTQPMPTGPSHGDTPCLHD